MKKRKEFWAGYVNGAVMVHDIDDGRRQAGLRLPTHLRTGGKGNPWLKNRVLMMTLWASPSAETVPTSTSTFSKTA